MILASSRGRAARWGLALVLLVAGPASAVAQDASKRDPQVDSAGLRSGYDEVFFWETADGAQRFTFGGLFQYHGDFFEGGPDSRDSQFDLRRMRLEFGGELHHRYRFKLEPNFNEAGVELEEAWIGVLLDMDGPLVMLGRMKEPFGLEEMTSRRWQDFVNFSILNQFSPAEDHGVTVIRDGAERTLEYGLAVYNGTGGDDVNDDKDVAGRVVVRPLAGSALGRAGLQIGAAITYGVADQDIDGSELKTEAKVPFLTFQPGSRLEGRRVRLGEEIAWLRGPFAFQAEALQVKQEMVGAGGSADVEIDGWYAQASWVVTGEDRTWQGVEPARPMLSGEGEDGGTGAVQLAARVSKLNVDGDLISAALIPPVASLSGVSSYDVGVNWYVNRHALLKLHWLHTVYEDEIVIDGDSLDSEDGLMLQFQLQW